MLSASSEVYFLRKSVRTLLLSCNRLSLSPLPLENGASDLPLNRMCELGRVILPLPSMWMWMLMLMLMLMLIADLWLKKRCVQMGAPRFCVVHRCQFSRQRFVGGRPVHLNGASKHPLLGFISKGRCRFGTCRNWDTLLDCWFDDKSITCIGLCCTVHQSVGVVLLV